MKHLCSCDFGSVGKTETQNPSYLEISTECLSCPDLDKILRSLKKEHLILTAGQEGEKIGGRKE